MSFSVNHPIRSDARVTPSVPTVVPTDVTCTWTDPSDMDHPATVVADGIVAGAYTFHAFFTPTIVGTWTRTWGASNLETTSVASVVVSA
jgi:hypothetical protein